MRILKTACVIITIALAGCSRDDQVKANKQVKKAEQQLKKDFHEAKKELKEDFHKAREKMREALKDKKGKTRDDTDRRHEEK